MKVLFDHQAFTIQQYGGISRYFYRLLNNIEHLSGIQYELPLHYSNNEYLKGLDNIKAKPFFPNRNFKGKYQLMRALNNALSVKHIRKGSFDLMHPTYYDPYFLAANLKRKSYVLTVYDMIHERFGNQFPELEKDRNTVRNKREVVNAATRVIAISHATKADLVALYGTDPSKIDVIHLASSFEDLNAIAEIEKKDYILFVGNRDIYKNFSFFLDVVSVYLRKYKLKLVCAGGPAFSENELEEMKKLGVEKQVVHKKIRSDEALMKCYQQALFFVFPSFYEGFGIPVLEAMQSGCPVVVSNTSSLVEVGGDAAVFFDPHDKSSLSLTLEKLINDEELRSAMMQKGLVHNKKFSWQKCAEETLTCYQRVYDS